MDVKASIGATPKHQLVSCWLSTWLSRILFRVSPKISLLPAYAKDGQRSTDCTPQECEAPGGGDHLAALSHTDRYARGANSVKNSLGRSV